MGATFLALVFTPAGGVLADELPPPVPIELRGEIDGDKDLSAVAVAHGGAFLVVGSDERHEVVVLRKTGDDAYTVDHEVCLAKADAKGETDVEGIAVSGSTVYVVGSHALKRKKLRPEDSRKKTAERMGDVEREKLRERLLRFELRPDGSTSDVSEIDLLGRIRSDGILEDFLKIPSKENGVDIEGIAAFDGRIYVGFRGPVLQEGWVPVLAFEPKHPEEADLRFVHLGGRGIRDLAATEDGLLILAGPMGESLGSFDLYEWDGRDRLPGSDVDPAASKPLESLAVLQADGPAEGSPEGLTVLGETPDSYSILLVSDGVPRGQPRRHSVPKPVRP